MKTNSRPTQNKRRIGMAASLAGLCVLLVNRPSTAGSTPPIMPSGSATNDASNRTLSSDTVLEQGKELYESGQYVAALDKFMKVLRRDPQQPEARQYLRLVVDQLRTKRQISHTRINSRSSTPAGYSTSLPHTSKGALISPKTSVPTAFLDEEVRKRVRQRQLLTMDLAAIPGVTVNVGPKQSQVEIKTSLLFADMTGGLREGGIPLLDRVAAWLKTFGQQPIAIHCYPEELDNSNLNGSLFLHRYAQLYGFFADEHQVPATRFVGTDVPKASKDNDDLAESQTKNAKVSLSTENAKVVIVSLGGGSEQEEEAPAPRQVAWLEFSIMASRPAFVPQEGESAALDLAALAKSGVKEWFFKISPAGTNTNAVMTLDGKGNLLRRVSWDGRDQKSGSFVAPGTYTCKLYAANAENSAMSREISLTIQRAGEAAPVVLEQPKKQVVVAAKPKPKPQAKPKAPKAPPPEEAAAEVPQVTSTLPEATIPAVPPKPAAAPKPVAAPEPAAAPAEAQPAVQASDLADADETDNSSNAIWKQVIQFDLNESDLKPTLKASLERIGKTLEVYPLQKVRILGFAERSETNAPALAKQRAEMVRQTLIKEYQVDASRIIVAGGRVGSTGKVEISITN